MYFVKSNKDHYDRMLRDKCSVRIIFMKNEKNALSTKILFGQFVYKHFICTAKSVDNDKNKSLKKE